MPVPAMFRAYNFSGRFMMSRLLTLSALLLFMPLMVFASEDGERIDLTNNWVGISSVLLFFVAYLAVMTE
jgi:hypothetical protein